jgi:hypothetical protein
MLSKIERKNSNQHEFDRLWRSLGIAIIAGAISACIGEWLAIVYFRNHTPPHSYYGDIGDAIKGILEAAIAASLAGGISVFIGMLLRWRLFSTEPGGKIILMFVALLVILVFVGCGAWLATLLLLH